VYLIDGEWTSAPKSASRAVEMRTRRCPVLRGKLHQQGTPAMKGGVGFDNYEL
jgi:hypothetical protein